MSNWINYRQLYPLTFTPIYQQRIWGGTRMHDVLGRDVPVGTGPVGESWELSDREDAMSVVAAGALEGKTFRELLDHYGVHLTGGKVPAHGRFPLLVKLIDAGDRLSLQVHPDERSCSSLGGGAEPKTEMWYIVAAARDAKILAGLSPRATKVQLRDKLNSAEVESLMQIYPSIEGDAYFIPSGTLHAIGAGNLILEIQQSSDTTYRVSDWGRVDENGASRELHVEKGMASINFTNRTTPRISGVSDAASHNRKFSIVRNCRHFTVDDLRLQDAWFDDTAPSGSCHLISAINRPVRIGRGHGAGGELTELRPGETALIPFCYGAYELLPLDLDGETKVLKTSL